jgi:phosphate-selective porin OprO/OprP
MQERHGNTTNATGTSGGSRILTTRRCGWPRTSAGLASRARWHVAVALALGSTVSLLAQEGTQAAAADTPPSLPATPLVQQPVSPPATPQRTFPPFVIQSDSGDNMIQIGALLQLDGRFVVDDPTNNVIDTFAARRLRVPIQGRVAGAFDFYFNPDFANNAVNIRDAYFDTRFSSAFRVRIGKGKSPFGLERLHSAAALLFIERALPTTVAPDRDFGVHALGDLAGNVVSYDVALGNGVVDGASADVDTNDGKDLVGRVVVRPFAARSSSALTGLGLALAGSRGEQPAGLNGFRSAAQQLFFIYAGGTNPAQGVGKRTRYSPQGFFYAGPFGGYFEWVRSTGDIQRGPAGAVVRAEVDHTAWQVAVSWVLTGERATDRGVRPANSFDPIRHSGRGALQIAARYNELRVSQNAIDLGFATPGSSRTAEAFAVGVNWYVNPYIKWVANFERTVFDGDPHGPRAAENALLFRGQLAF